MKLIYTILLTLVPLALLAQQDPMFSKFHYDNSAFFNPASTGRSNLWTATLMHRAQWVSLEGAPRTTAFTFDGPIQSERAGLGFSFFYDQIGFERNTGLYANYAYRFPTGDNSWLSMGIRAGANYVGADFSKITTPEGTLIDPLYAAEPSTLIPKVGFGVFWNTERAYLGVSVPAFAAISPDDNFTFEDDGVYLSKHYYLTGGYVFDLGSSDFQIKPFTFIRYHKSAPLQVDLAAQFWFRELFSVGAMWRMDDAIGAMLEVPIGQSLSVSYAYDYTTSEIRKYAQGAHEIILSYAIIPKSTAIPSINRLPGMRRF